MPISSRSFVQSTVILLIIALVALLAIVGTTVWLSERSQYYFANVMQARDARTTASNLRASLQQAETSQRGFLVTGNESYVAPFAEAEKNAPRLYEQLNQALLPFPENKPALDQLKTTLDQKFAEMEQTIALKRAGNDAEAIAIVNTDKGKALMDQANAFLFHIIKDADDKLSVAVADQQTTAFWLRWVSLGGAVVIILVVGGSAIVVLRYTRELAEARDNVTALNAGLEARVSERTADLEARTADLSQANDEIQRFAYIVTHDLRAPLVNIMGFTAELESSLESIRPLLSRAEAGADPVVAEAQQAIDEDLPEAIEFIRSSTRKMDGLINAILKLSREGRRVLRPETVNLADALGASAAAVQHQVGEANGELNLSVQVPSIFTDKLALDQVVGNLLDNAVKYRAASRPLRIEVTAGPLPGHANRIFIDIADNGRGIAEQDLERVFELFRRSGVQDQPGEGIGLAYVRAVVRNLGGNITLTSGLDRGTTFHITLPRTLQLAGSTV